MKSDTLTKTLLAAIAIALWVNVVIPWVQPGSALAKVDYDHTSIELGLASIELGIGSIKSDLIIFCLH